MFAGASGRHSQRRGAVAQTGTPWPVVRTGQSHVHWGRKEAGDTQKSTGFAGLEHGVDITVGS